MGAAYPRGAAAASRGTQRSGRAAAGSDRGQTNSRTAPPGGVVKVSRGATAGEMRKVKQQNRRAKLRRTSLLLRRRPPALRHTSTTEQEWPATGRRGTILS